MSCERVQAILLLIIFVLVNHVVVHNSQGCLSEFAFEIQDAAGDTVPQALINVYRQLAQGDKITKGKVLRSPLIPILLANSINSPGVKEHVHKITNKNFIQEVFALFDYPNHSIQRGALNIINFITIGSDEQAEALIDCGVLSYLNKFIFYHKNKIAEEDFIRGSLEALNMLTIKNVNQTKIIAESGITKNLISLLQSKNLSIVQNSLNILTNIIYDADMSARCSIYHEAKQDIFKLLHNQLFLPETVKMLAFLTETDAENHQVTGCSFQENYEQNILTHLAKLLDHNDEEIRTYSIATIANFAIHFEKHAHVVLKVGVLQHIDKFLYHENTEVISEALKLMLSFSEEDYQTMFPTVIIDAIVDLFAHSNLEIQKYSISVAVNIFNYNPDANDIFIMVGALENMDELLVHPEIEVKIKTLMFFIILLHNTDGEKALQPKTISIIIQLLDDPYEDIREKANLVIDKLLIRENPKNILGLVNNGLFKYYCQRLQTHDAQFTLYFIFKILGILEKEKTCRALKEELECMEMIQDFLSNEEREISLFALAIYTACLSVELHDSMWSNNKYSF